MKHRVKECTGKIKEKEIAQNSALWNYNSTKVVKWWCHLKCVVSFAVMIYIILIHLCYFKCFAFFFFAYPPVIHTKKVNEPLKLENWKWAPFRRRWEICKMYVYVYMQCILFIPTIRFGESIFFCFFSVNFN